MLLDTREVQCPYCGEYFEAVIDTSQTGAQYVEDCYVCCCPILFTLEQHEPDSIQVHTRRENE